MQRLLDRFRARFKFIDRVGEQVTDPIKFRRMNGWLVVFWTFMLPFAIFTGILSLVVFISVLSLYANWATHLGVWAASRSEARQVEDVEEETEDYTDAAMAEHEECLHCGQPIKPPSSNG